MAATQEAPPAAPPASRRRGAGDVVAAAALGWALWALARTDGGVDLLILRRAAWPLLLAAPLAALELRRLPRRAAGLVAWYGTAALAAVAFGGIRSGFVQPATVYGLLPVGALLTMRLWRRPWGPAAVGGMLAVVFAVTWWDGFLAWAGGALDPGAFETWRTLSWHNQSAILMGACGLVALGVAVTADRRSAAGVAVGAAASGFAAAWLTGSRGGLVAVASGAVVVAVATRFRRPLRWAAALVGSVAAVVLLTGFVGGQPVEQAIANKGLSTADSALARLDHMAAGVAMFTERPLLGHGLGSYGRAAPAYASGNSNPSFHAHNELLEPFAEGGLAFGGAMLALVAGVAAAGVRRLRRGTEPGRPPRPGLVAGSLGALAALTAHATIDFDWLFPLLALLAAVTAGVVLAADRHGALETPWGWTAMVPVAALLAAGLAGASVTLAGSPPWSTRAAAGEVAELLATHDARAALDRAGVARGWNPADRLLRTLEAAAAHEAGNLTASDLAGTLDAGAPSLPSYNAAAASLLRTGEIDAAAGVLATVTRLYRERPAWALDTSIDETWRLTVVIAGQREGCGGAEAAAAELAADPLTGRMSDPHYAEAALPFCG